MEISNSTTPAVQEGTEFLTVKQAAKFLSVSVSTIRNWKRDNKISSKRIGRIIHIPKGELLNSMKQVSLINQASLFEAVAI